MFEHTSPKMTKIKDLTRQRRKKWQKIFCSSSSIKNIIMVPETEGKSPRVKCEPWGCHKLGIGCSRNASKIKHFEWKPLKTRICYVSAYETPHIDPNSGRRRSSALSGARIDVRHQNQNSISSWYHARGAHRAVSRPRCDFSWFLRHFLTRNQWILR